MDYKEQVEEFIESINTDFYLDLDQYSHYADKKFESKDLSITILLKIAESNLLRQLNRDNIFNTIRLESIMMLVLDRISKCGDESLAAEAKEIVQDMECYEGVNDGEPQKLDIFIEGAGVMSPKLSKYTYEQEYTTTFEVDAYDKFKEVNKNILGDSSLNTDPETDKKRRISKYL